MTEKQKALFLICVGMFVIIATVVVLRDLMLEKSAQHVTASQITPTPIVPPSDTASSAASLLMQATLTVPQTPGNPKVTLTSGKGAYNQNGYQASLTMLPNFSVEKRIGDGFDLFGIYEVNYGGSGNFTYVGLFHVAKNEMIQQGAESLGSHIRITGLHLQDDPSGAVDYEVVVDYDRLSQDQSMAATPETPVRKVLKVKDHKFLPQ